MKKNTKLLKLAKFVDLLKETKIYRFNITSFRSRLRLQKYMYIAERMFGLKFNYPFNLYLKGPYSSALADDYYKLSEFKKDLDKIRYDKDKFEKFKEFVKDKNSTELEVIAITHFAWKANKHLINKIYPKEKLEELVVRKVINLKRSDEKFVRKVLKIVQNMEEGDENSSCK